MNTKSQTHQKRVYEIARDFVFTRGVRGWNMDILASEVGITKRTLYRIIPSKEELILGIVIGFIRDVQERLNRSINEEGDYFSAMEKIAVEFPILVDRMSSRVMGEIFQEYPAIEESVVERRNELTAGLIAFFKRGIDEGHLRDDLKPDFILQMFQASVLYFIRLHGRDETFAGKIRAAFTVLVHGMKAPDKS